MSITNEINSRKDLLGICKNFRKIIITGPQRSGTTFLTRQLAEHLSITPIYLENFYVHDEDKFVELLNSEEKAVIQCPTMSHLLHELALDGVLVIFMRRKLEDIIASEARIHWEDQSLYLRGVHMDEAVFEKAKYLKSNIPDLNFYQHVSEIKVQAWSYYQSERIKDKVELSYSSLEQMFPDAWIKKVNRSEFHPRQTESDALKDSLVNRSRQMLSVNNQDHFCQLFVDSGKGFSEEHSMRKRIFAGLNKIVFDLNDFSNIENLRFDPLNDFARVEIIDIKAYHDQKSHIVDIEDHNGTESDGNITFNHNDPNIFLSVPSFHPEYLEISFAMENQENTLKYLYEKEKEKNLPPVSDNKKKKKGESDILLKKINGKLNLQAGELSFIKSLITKIKPGDKDQPVTIDRSNLVSNDDIAALIEKEERIKSKLIHLETTLSEKQLTIKSLLAMTGVEIKTALDKINATFEANEKNLVIIEEYRKNTNELEKEIAVLKFQLEQNKDLDKDKEKKYKAVSDKLDSLKIENAKLQEAIKIFSKNERTLKSLRKSLEKKSLEIKVQGTKHKDEKVKLENEISVLKADYETLNTEYNELLTRCNSLQEELLLKEQIKREYDRLLGELNFITTEML